MQALHRVLKRSSKHKSEKELFAAVASWEVVTHEDISDAVQGKLNGISENVHELLLNMATEDELEHKSRDL